MSSAQLERARGPIETARNVFIGLSATAFALYSEIGIVPSKASDVVLEFAASTAIAAVGWEAVRHLSGEASDYRQR
jgi:hypothetical protein